MKYVLSCDGGGIRGFAVLVFLSKLERQLGRPLHQVFDLMVGTSVGAMIVSAIGCCQMTVDQLVDKFGLSTSDISGVSLFISDPLNKGDDFPKYKGEGKTRMLKDVYGNGMYKRENGPVVIITGYDLKIQKPVFYANDNSYLSKIPIYHLLDGATAVPGYYPAVLMPGGIHVVDGGICINDPSYYALEDAKKRWPKEEIRLVSIGTGYPKINLPIDSAMWGINQWSRIISDITRDNSSIETVVKRSLGDGCIRINSPLSLDFDSSFDNITVESVNYLMLLGIKWWNMFGSKTFKLLQK